MPNLKLFLLSSTTLVGALSVTSAQAAEWEVKVGGYYNAMAAYASTDGLPSDTDLDGVDTYQRGEIHFKPEITLDNGIKIGANIQLESEDRGNNIDDAYVFIKGSFGEILLGDQNSAGYQMSYGAPNLQFFLNDDRGSNYDPEPYVAYAPFMPVDGGVYSSSSSFNTGSDLIAGTLGSTYIENDRSDEAARITYFTPRFAGFQLGVSYARDDSGFSNNSPTDCSVNACDYFDIGANYVNSFGGFDVAASGRWGIASGRAGDDDPTVSGFGLNVGHGNVTIGGSFAEQNGTFSSDGQAYELGASYDTGPWTFTANYFNGSNIDNEHAFALGSNAPDEDLNASTIGIRYQLAKGVRLNGFGAYVNFDEAIGDGGLGTPGNDLDGFVIGTGIGLSF